MLRSGSSAELVERALDLAWSLWAELGVSGWRRRHQDWGIDPEPLVVFTAALENLDPRMRDESLDWCISFGKFLSRARLRNLLAEADAPTRKSFGTYSATVNAHSKLNWPLATRARKYVPTGRSQLDDFSEPSLLALRLRALLGVSARAEIVRVLMSARSGSPTALEVATEIDYTKRNVAEALESLRLAGIVDTSMHGNQLRYRLNRREIRNVVTPLPKVFPRWRSIFSVISHLIRVESRDQAMSKTARAVEARRAVDEMDPEIRAAGLRMPPLKVKGEGFWDAFSEWATELMTGLAFGEPAKAFDPERVPHL